MKSIQTKFYLLLLLVFCVMVSCSDDDEPMEMENEEEEVITQVVLTFTPQDGNDAVIATFLDADGDGVGTPSIDDIELTEGVAYQMEMTLTNTLPSTPEDITSEIREEDDEHQFFFAFTDGMFADPNGNGNVDNPGDPIIYNDTDDNGLPVGLSTTWTAGEPILGTFNIILKHQPDEKSATSDVNTGGTDLDVTFSISIVEGEEDEEEEEVINEIILTFVPLSGGDTISSRFFDADGEGVGAPSIDEINLTANTEYDMSITLTNTLGAEPEDVTAEILEEDDEHMFFFEFETNVFSSPGGDGNLDERGDPVNYNDMDENGLPVGLSTNWVTGDMSGGAFRVVLKHQPGEKSATSDVNTGGTDLDITFPLSIVEGDEDEEEEEVINEIILTFVPLSGGDTISGRFFDADGEGVGAPSIDEINLTVNTEYEMSITLTNTLGAEPEDVTAEILEEDDEHMFFFEFDANVFSSPEGDGNVDERGDPVNYNDMDENGLPVGLSTNWATRDMSISGVAFRVVLKHQPGEKSATSDVSVGGTDVDITIPLNITL